MYPPITCRCGYPLGDKFETYRQVLAKRLDNTKNIKIGMYYSSLASTESGKILDMLHIKSLCCRTKMIAHINFHEYKAGEIGIK